MTLNEMPVIRGPDVPGNTGGLEIAVMCEKPGMG